jgi:uncharacterized protein (TIGR03437 family)
MCEQSMGAEAQTLRSWAKQANAQGVTWFSASGDAGGADCNSYRAAGLAVDAPASIPEVTGVGGTEFKEGTGHFWNSANDGNGASVLSYIPEVVWNDSAADGEPAASGGGASTLFTKPAWQTGPGVPNDNARHVPDVALTASADHDGYLVYTSGSLQVFGGTSAPTPAFAGIGALLNQFVVASGAQSTPGLSNINPKLYALAETAPQVFHDISAGNNIVTVNCPARSRGCATAPVGYSAGAGYDQATGLGSIDAYRLVAAWNGGATSPSLLPTTAPVINELVNSASSAAVFAPGMVLTVYGLRLAPSVQAASSLPLPDSIAGVSATVNGVAAPLLYVSPEQLNVQIPYETAVGAAQFILTSGDQTTSMSIDVAAAAPGIFTDSSGAVLPLGSASRGQVVTLFVTGAGAVLPNIATGTAPSPSASTADLPKPVQGTTVTVGGVPADVQFIGIAPGLVGVVQIDCLVPDAAPLGPQPVVVAIGGIASAPATLNIPN